MSRADKHEGLKETQRETGETGPLKFLLNPKQIPQKNDFMPSHPFGDVDETGKKKKMA